MKQMYAVPATADPAGASNTAWLGNALFTNYLLPFEVAAVILTVAIIAAIMLTLRQRIGTRKQNPAAQVAVKASDRVRIVKMASATKEATTP
jgi:NADH-quinone oxidoreductase subunit J